MAVVELCVRPTSSAGHCERAKTSRRTVGIRCRLDILCAIIIWLASASSTRPEEYCQWETFNATCGHNHVILITYAVYGRMRIGRCIPYDYLVGCSTDVYDQVASRCSGRQHCSVPIPDTELFKVHPCRKDLVAYMEASYQCVPVAGAPVRSDASSRVSPCEGEVTLTSLSGYLSGTIARRTGYGSERCPWVVRAPAGQHIELTVYDFGLDAAAAAAASGSSTSSGVSTVTSSGATGSQRQQSQSQPQQQHQRPQKQTSAQNSVLSDTQSAPSPQLSAVVSFDAGSGQVHCHVVAVYYEGESRHTLPSAAPRNATPATAVPTTTLSHTAVSRRKPDSPRAAEGEPHHLRLCPSVAGFTSSRVGPSVGPLEQRKKVVYRTNSNQLYIYTPNATGSSIKHHHVMLRYDIVGCPDPQLPAMTWMLRRGETLAVFCNQTAERWHLVCKENSWVGTYGNCTKPVVPIRPEPPQKYVRSFPLGLLVAIAIGVISGVVIGFILLIAIFSCRKRFQETVVQCPPTTEHSVLLVNYENRQNAYKLIDFKSTAGPLSTDTYASTTVVNGGIGNSPGRWPPVPPPAMMTSSTYPRHATGAVVSEHSSLYGGGGTDQQSTFSPPSCHDDWTLPDVAAPQIVEPNAVNEDDNNSEIVLDAASASGHYGGLAADGSGVGQDQATSVVLYPADVYVSRELMRLNETTRRIGVESSAGVLPGRVQDVSECCRYHPYDHCCQSHLTATCDGCHSCSAVSHDRCCGVNDPDPQQQIYGGIYRTAHGAAAPLSGNKVNNRSGCEEAAGCNCWNEQVPVANRAYHDADRIQEYNVNALNDVTAFICGQQQQQLQPQPPHRGTSTISSVESGGNVAVFRGDATSTFSGNNNLT